MTPKDEACAIGTAHRRHRGVGRALAVEGGHLPHVHAVDMVGGEHRHRVGVVGLEHVEVLVGRVGGALEAAAEGVGARQQHLDHSLVLVEPRRPGGGDVAHQRLGLVLRQHVDGRDAGVHQVAQHEIDDPVAVGERQRRLRVLGGQGMQPRTFTSGENESDDFHGPGSLS